MLGVRFKEMYSKLLKDFDNILSGQHDLSLWCDYGLGSDKEVVGYLVSKLRSARQLIHDMQNPVVTRYTVAHYPIDNDVRKVFSAATRGISSLLTKLLITSDAVDQYNADRSVHLSIFQIDYTVRNILGELYKVLENLTLFLYSDNKQSQCSSKRCLALEAVASLIAHSIAVLQSASSQRIALNIREETIERIFRERVLEEDEGFVEDPILKEADLEEEERNRLKRNCVNNAAIMGARRSAYVLACCALLCHTLTLDTQKEQESSSWEVHSMAESLLTISLLLSNNVPTEFRVLAADIVSNKFHSVTQKLLNIIGRESKNSTTVVHSANTALLKSLKSVITTVHNAFQLAAHSYAEHAQNKPVNALPWNTREEFHNSFAVLNIVEAMFLSHHMSHMLELNLQEEERKMQHIERKHDVLTESYTTALATVTASRNVGYCIKGVESALRSAFSMLCSVKGEDFIGEFLRIQKSDAGAPIQRLNRGEIDTYFPMYEIAQQIQRACFKLLHFKKYVYRLNVHRPRMTMYIRSVHMHCIRVFDILSCDDFHDFAWKSSCKSALPVLPGELPENVPTYELIHNAPSVTLSRAMIEEALSLRIFRKLQFPVGMNETVGSEAVRNEAVRDETENIAQVNQCSPSSLLYSICDVAQCMKEWMPNVNPSSLLSGLKTLLTYTTVTPEERGGGNLP